MTDQPPAPSPCRTCSVSRKACDRTRELRGRPCCHVCAHPDDDLEVATSEDW